MQCSVILPFLVYFCLFKEPEWIDLIHNQVIPENNICIMHLMIMRMQMKTYTFQVRSDVKALLRLMSIAKRYSCLGQSMTENRSVKYMICIGPFQQWEFQGKAWNIPCIQHFLAHSSTTPLKPLMIIYPIDLHTWVKTFTSIASLTKDLTTNLQLTVVLSQMSFTLKGNAQ